MGMTENEAIKIIGEVPVSLNYEGSLVEIKKAYDVIQKAIEEIQEYRAIGTVEELKALKEKAEPKELAEHNFQDEVHYYLCPSCRSIVSCTQNYCDECGQALDWQ